MVRRVLYALGPGDIVRAYAIWKDGRDVVSEMSVAFSSQFLDLCRDKELEVRAISSNPRRDLVRDGRFTLENRPKPFRERGGPWYHLSQLLYACSLVATALRIRAEAVIVDTFTTHWFLLAIFRVVGIPVVASLHGALWPRGFPPRGSKERLLLWLDKWLFWRWAAAATACVSPECERQVRSLQGRPRGPIFQHRAQYRPELFAAIPPVPDRGPLHLLFAGRVEPEKGALDLVEMAALLEAAEPGMAEWHVCGPGGAIERVATLVRTRGLGHVFHLRGKLNQEALLEEYAWAHAVVVPTRSECAEGLPMVAAESVLAGRPVVLSDVCPAIEVLGEACARASPDDPRSYAEVIRRLLGDPAEYQRRVRACTEVRRQFTDRSRGFTAALEQALASLA
jgi:glycosyltransferase involved in cell wall biosynthesis